MALLILWILIGLIPAAIAQSKGKSFVGWWIYGCALFIIALPHALIMRPDQQKEASVSRIFGKKLSEGMKKKKCPYCAELIKAEARVCRYCSSTLSQKNGSEYCASMDPVEFGRRRATIALANDILIRWNTLDDVSRNALAIQLLAKIRPNFDPLLLSQSEIRRLVTDVARSGQTTM